MDKTLNSSKLFLKIPVNLNIPVKHLQLYAGYLWFKKIDRSGTFTKSSLNSIYRNRNNYWLKKLISAGLIIDHGTHYSIKAYQEVWRLLGVARVKNKKTGISSYRYMKLEFNDKSFLKDVKDEVFKHLVNRKKSQIIDKLTSRRASEKKRIKHTKTYTKLSGEAVKKLLGYKSNNSGQIYRSKYFKVQTQGKYSYLNLHGCLEVRNECSLVCLN